MKLNETLISLISAIAAAMASFLVGKLNVSGAKEDAYSKSFPGLIQEIKELTDERAELKGSIVQLEAKNKELEKKIDELNTQIKLLKRKEEL